MDSSSIWTRLWDRVGQWRSPPPPDVLGMNARNLEYLRRHNPPRAVARVDDKLWTKARMNEVGVSVPRLVGSIDAQAHLRDWHRRISLPPDFVIKPVRGAQGHGVLVVTDTDRTSSPPLFRSVDGSWLDVSAVNRHLSDVLSGLHSLGEKPDAAMIEERLATHPTLGRLSFRGLPDLRIIVYRGVPAAAMVRLPTRRSHGRANLHQGAVGVGLSLADGRAMGAVWEGQGVEVHPDTGDKLIGWMCPDWSLVLATAARAADALELGYVGVDLVLCAERGPLLLEANARPGLGIQRALGHGLRPQLDRIDAWAAVNRTPVDDRVAWVRTSGLG